MDKIADIVINGIIIGAFIYCIWLFFNSIDAHLTQQMNLWSQHLGM